jgi:hypothetical protein
MPVSILVPALFVMTEVSEVTHDFGWQTGAWRGGGQANSFADRALQGGNPFQAE